MPITVKDLLEANQALGLRCLSGVEHLDRTITEHSINRPGLALSGFFKYFAHKRVQVFGLVETTYLKSLEVSQREERLAELFSYHVPCVVTTRKRRPTALLQKMAEKNMTPILGSPLVTGNFINLATLALEDLVAPTTNYYGTFVSIQGVGVLIEGDSGVVKSETALTLLQRGHSLVSDDITNLKRESDGTITGTSPTTSKYHMEIRGLGIVNVPLMFSYNSVRDKAEIDLIVRLEHMRPGIELDRTGLDPQSRPVLGVEIPFITLPVAPGRDMANVIQAAAMNQRLKKVGRDPAKEYDAQLRKALAERKPKPKSKKRSTRRKSPPKQSNQ